MIRRVSALSTHRNWERAVRESIDGSLERFQTHAKASSSSLRWHLHACQVLVTPEPYAGSNLLQLGEAVREQVEDRMATLLATRPAGSQEAITFSTVREEGASTWPSSAYSLPSFGAVVDRLAVASSSSSGNAWVGQLGVHTTLYYSGYRSQEDSLQAVEDRMVGPFYAWPARRGDRHFKAVGRWPGEHRASSEGEEVPWGIIGSAGTDGGARAARSPWSSTFQQSSSSPEKLFFRPPHDSSLARSFFMLSDNEPYAALRQLDRGFPHSFKYGAVAAWTPFVTGHPFTLFLNGQTYHGGLVGVGYTTSNEQEKATLHYGGLEVLTEPVEITKSQGNIVLELQGGKRPAQEMMRALGPQQQQDQLTSEHLVVAVLKKNPLEPGSGQTKRILSSDPGKGHLALETSSHGDLAPGMTLQFALRTPSDRLVLSKPVHQQDVVVGQWGEAIRTTTEATADDGTVSEAPLVFSSETGLVVSHRAKQTNQGGGPLYLSDLQTIPGAYVRVSTN